MILCAAKAAGIQRAIRSSGLAYTIEKTIGKCYNMAGKHPLTYNKVIDIISVPMNKRVGKLHTPHVPVVEVLTIFEGFHLPLPIKSEQVLRLNENRNFGYDDAADDFGFHPLSFEHGIHKELQGRIQ